MNERRMLGSLQPYLDHKSRCPALDVMWHKGPCDCGFEELMSDIDKRHHDEDQRLEVVLKAAHESGIESEDLDEDVHEVASQEASMVNNRGLEGQVLYLLEHNALPSALQGLSIPSKTRTLPRYSTRGIGYRTWTLQCGIELRCKAWSPNGEEEVAWSVWEILVDGLCGCGTRNPVIEISRLLASHILRAMG